MKGRVESSIKTEKNIEKLLSELPHYVTEYYYNLSSRREPKSCLEYIRKIKNFLIFINSNPEDINLKDITETNITIYMKSISKKKINNEIVETSFSYRKQNHTILKSFFSYLLKKGYIDKNPMDLIEREVGRDYPKRKYLKEEDLIAILHSANVGAGTIRMVNRQKEWKDRDLAILMLFMQTGMRETALTEINIEDIDFENNKLIIIDKGHEFHEYYLSEKLMDYIKEWTYHREYLLNGIETDALFISSNRKRITASAVSYIVKKYSKDALGYEVSPHKLRAAYCNLLLRKTGNLHLVSKLVGHKRPDTTEIYLDDTSKEDKKKAADIITNSIF